MFEDQEVPADQAATGAEGNMMVPTPSMSTVSSIGDDVFSTRSAASTKASTAASTSAFAQGWKAAMHQTRAEKPLVYSDIDRFALDVTETLDQQLAKGTKLSKSGASVESNDSTLELLYPALFRSICVCDMSIKGHAVALSSKHFELSLRGLKVGQARFLNLPRDSPHSCHLSTRVEADKRTHHILEYSNVLVSAEADKVAYVVATQMDVTRSVESIAEFLNARFWMGRGMHGPAPSISDQSSDDADTESVDWCQIAREEPGVSDVAYQDLRAAKDELILSDANVLEFWEMIEDIRSLHKEYFTLMMGQEATGAVWTINYVSPALKNQAEDVKASFSHTDPPAMLELGTALAGEQAATLVIKWGVSGEPKRIYLCPMFRQERLCWLCFLVKEEIGNIWDLSYSKVPSP